MTLTTLVFPDGNYMHDIPFPTVPRVGEQVNLSGEAGFSGAHVVTMVRHAIGAQPSIILEPVR